MSCLHPWTTQAEALVNTEQEGAQGTSSIPFVINLAFKFKLGWVQAGFDQSFVNSM